MSEAHRLFNERCFGELRNYAEELERENAALRKDKKRLDWLDNYGYEYEGLLERGWGIALPLGQKNNTRDIRKAIDMNLWPITIDAAAKEQP